MDWSNILTAVITFVLTALISLTAKFVSTTIKGYKQLKEEVEKLKDSNQDLQKNLYKQSLWSIYSSYVETGREIPPDRYAFAKHCLEKYKQFNGNGTTEFWFEQLEQNYSMQQKEKEENILHKKAVNRDEQKDDNKL